MPGTRDEGHRRHQDDETGQRALDHDLAAEAIRQPAPQRRQQRREPGGDAQAGTCPHRNLADIGDAKLRDEQRQERHHEREAGVAHERRGGHGEEIAPPGRHGCVGASAHIRSGS